MPTTLFNLSVIKRILECADIFIKCLGEIPFRPDFFEKVLAKRHFAQTFLGKVWAKREFVQAFFIAAV